jgi:ABC-type nitrate/sulfonate/bicarbonate transport system ATPase subunit
VSVIEDQVCAKLQERAGFGLQKYGVTLERTDLTTLDWLTHAQEEAMDLANYLQVLINREKIRTMPVVLDEETHLYLEERHEERQRKLSEEVNTTNNDNRLDYGS